MTMGGRTESRDLANVNFQDVDVIVVADPDGRRSVVRGHDLISAQQTADGRTTARIMTIECDTWDEVETVLRHCDALGPLQSSDRKDGD